MPRRAIVVGFGEWGPRPQEYAFDVPPPSPPNAPAVASGPGRSTRATVPSVDTPMPSSGFVEAPPPGHIALEALADGTEVWVAHRADDSISVLPATLVADLGLTGPVDWWPEAHRLGGGWDSHGWSVQGFAPLPGYAFRRLEGSRIEVLPRRAPDEEGSIEARDAAPALDGPAHPYALLPLTASWNDVPDGRVARLDVSLVFGVDGQPRLCKMSDFLLDHHFRGCSPEFPALAGSFRVAARVVFSGPTVVRRRGNVADLAVVEHGYAGYASVPATP